jgi:uncharacterized membrane protein
LQQPWLYLSRKIKIVILPLISAILTAVYVAMDKFYLSAISPNSHAFGFLSLWIGAAATIVFLFLMKIPLKEKQILGSYVDPNFEKPIIPKGKLLKWIIIAGLGASASSLSYFFIVGVSSPSTVIPFSRLVIIYLILAESLADKDSPTLIESQSVIMILVGVFLMATTDLGFDPLVIILVIGPMNIGNMVFTIAQRKAKRMIYQNKRVDSLNLRFWTLVFNSIFLSIMTVPFLTPETIGAIIGVNAFQVTFIVFDMMISTFALIAYIRALGIAKMSIVNAITSFSIVLGIPTTLIGNFFFPGAFGTLPSEPLFWIFKGFGIFIIISGIVSLAISQVKGYLLIYITSTAEDILRELLKIKGISLVSAVAGRRLLIATLRIRSLGKAYRTIITDLEKIKGIEKVITLTTIKEWEKL